MDPWMRRCWELLAYCINYIFARKIKEEMEKLISNSVSLCAKVFQYTSELKGRCGIVCKMNAPQ
jgi:hypothetical protein